MEIYFLHVQNQILHMEIHFLHVQNQILLMGIRFSLMQNRFVEIEKSLSLLGKVSHNKKGVKHE